MRITTTTRFTLAGVTLTGAMAAMAQDPTIRVPVSAEYEAVQKQRSRRDVVESETFDGPLSSPLVAPPVDLKTQLVFQGSTKDNATGEARIAGVVGHVWDSPLTLDFRLRGPLNKDTGASELANLDGLLNSVTGDLGLGLMIWNPNIPANPTDQNCLEFWCATRRADMFCFARGQKPKIAKLMKAVPEAQSRLKEARRRNAPATQIDRLEAQVEKLEGELETANTIPMPKAECEEVLRADPHQYEAFDCATFVRSMTPPNTSVEDLDFLQAYNAQFSCSLTAMPIGSVWRTRYRSLLREWPPPILLSAHAVVGQESFDFVDPTTLEQASASEINHALVASAGVLLEPIGYVGVNYRFERSHTASPETTLCIPLGGTGAMTCNDVHLGAPTETTHNRIQFELRKFATSWLAVNPKFTYDANDSVAAVEAPIYFLTDKDRGFTGGVNVGWRSDTDEVTATLFVGAAFTLFPGS